MLERPIETPVHSLTPRQGQFLPLDLARLKARGFVVPDGPRTRLSEEVRVIKRQLLQGVFPDGAGRPTGRTNGNLVMVTSSLPGEGKTFVAVNLALSISAERDVRIMLVDGDCHRQGLGTVLGMEVQPGLTDLLAGEVASPAEVLVRTSLPHLTILPAGRPHSQATELMASRRMAALLTELASRYPDRLILVDTPPVLASAEASALASQVGHALVVVEKGRTPGRALGRTLDLLVGCPCVGCILNMSAFDADICGHDNHERESGTPHRQRLPMRELRDWPRLGGRVADDPVDRPR